MRTGSFVRILGVLVGLAGTLALTGSQKSLYSRRDKAFYADPALVDFVRPGLAITINSATLTPGGAITITYTLTDPAGLPLDAAGVTTPGAVSLTFLCSYIPHGQEQYVSLVTAQATGKVLGTVTRPTFEEASSPGTALGPGQYQYTYAEKAPLGFDITQTVTVGIAASRNLTAFNLGTNYAGNTYNFVPSGAAVTTTRDVVRTASCNTCHDQLAFHGGHAFGVQECVLCHQPQNVDPSTGNTLDFKVMIHKVHMGASLPSVIAGTPYEIIGYMNSVNNFSTVVYPADPGDPRRCETCHSQTTGAAQAKAFMTEPSRAACGACHDNVNFATGENHPGGIQTDDTECAGCHIPQGEMDFDASILGAHVAPSASSLLSGLAVTITGIKNGAAGTAPVVSFTVQDKHGNPVALSALGSISFTMAGPTSDYGYTSFGSGVTTPGYVTESAANASCPSTGTCMYTFTHTVPANATGTYAIGVEARRTDTVPELVAGATVNTAITYGAPNQVMYFSVDGSPVTPRREVVQLSNCNQCHVSLQVHGSLRNNTEYCVFCHNPSNTDAATRATAVVASDKTQPPQGINFNLLVHRIHDGVNVTANGGKPYIVVGFGGSHNDFSGVLFPVMSPTGSATDLTDCAVCHVNSTEQNDLDLTTNLNPVVDPQGLINPVQPFTSACTGCHVQKAAASHALSNTTSLGEACSVCHDANGAFSVDSVHAGQ
jgi:OmcA/MtrC family decaheme c-type cytochrome